MQTVRDGGWLVERGPTSALETTPLLGEIFHDLGILGERLYAREGATKRYIVRGGALHALPMNPFSFLATGLWSLPAKLRLLREPFIGRSRREESVAQFVRRRLGPEFLDYAINPFVAGVYAGDPEQLSVQSAFPKLYALEQRYGGLLIGAVRSRGERKKRKEIAKDRARLFAFAGGMQTFPDAIASSLGSSVQCNAAVEAIIPIRLGRYPTYEVHYRDGEGRRTQQAAAVILAAPAYAAAGIIRPIDPETSTLLQSVPYPPVAEVFFGFRKTDLGRALDGFGFLVPEVEHRNVLGTLWSSALFPERAPDGCEALTSFVGGARAPHLVSLGDGELASLVLDDLRGLMNIDAQPVYSSIVRWERSIPQYTIGHQRLLASLERFEQNFRGTFICSNYRGGIAVGDCVMSAEAIARRVAAHLQSSGSFHPPPAAVR